MALAAIVLAMMISSSLTTRDLLRRLKFVLQRSRAIVLSTALLMSLGNAGILLQLRSLDIHALV